MDLISVIVPVYKVEEYLDRCVQSIVDQTYTNLEIILVDDGSTDRCPQMCDEWACRDSRIRVIHKENGGLSDARNAGMAIASGEYVAFVDSDDWLSCRYIERLYEAIGETGTRLSVCGVRFVEEADAQRAMDTTASEETEIYSAERAFSPDGWKRIRAVAWNKLYHRSLLEGEAYPVGKHHEDEFFTYRIVDKAERVAYVDEELYYYLQRPGSIMHGFSPKRMDALEAYFERLELFRVKYPSLYREEKANCCAACAVFYCAALQADAKDMSAIRERAVAFRKRIRFALWELGRYTPKQILYIIGTGVNLPLFCRLLNHRRA